MVSNVRDKKFVFLLSHQRSGSTYLRTCLNKHPSICAPNESHFLLPILEDDTWSKATSIDIVESQRKHKRSRHFESLEIDEELVLTTAETAFFRIIEKQEKKSSIKVIVDKTPEYLFYFEKIRKLFPNSHFIFLIRNGVDNLLSLESRGWQGPFQENRADYWKRGCQIISHAQATLGPSKSILVRYEDLINNPSKIARSLTEFLEIEISDKHLTLDDQNFEGTTKLEKELGIHSSIQIGKKMDRTRKHKLSLEDRQYLESILGQELKKFGYLDSYVTSRTIDLRYNLYLFLGRLANRFPENIKILASVLRRKLVIRRGQL